MFKTDFSFLSRPVQARPRHLPVPGLQPGRAGADETLHSDERDGGAGGDGETAQRQVPVHGKFIMILFLGKNL